MAMLNNQRVLWKIKVMFETPDPFLSPWSPPTAAPPVAAAAVASAPRRFALPPGRPPRRSGAALPAACADPRQMAVEPSKNGTGTGEKWGVSHGLSRFIPGK